MRATAVDRVVLDAGDRHRRRIVLKGERGTRIPARPRRGGARCATATASCSTTAAIVLVAGQAGAAGRDRRARTPLALVRLAWHLGNRHTDVQIVGDRLRIRRDHVLEEMVAGLGATVTPVEAPFDPEAGACAA